MTSTVLINTGYNERINHLTLLSLVENLGRIVVQFCIDPGTVDQALKAPRTAKTARPVSATSGSAPTEGLCAKMHCLNDPK